MWRIAIPSYKRHQTLATKTMALLRREGICPDRIDVFVADADEFIAYSALRPADYRYNIICGVPGIHHQREFIHAYYPEGQRVVSIDDDITAIKSVYGASVFHYISRMFQVAEDAGCSLWGIYPNANGLCLDDVAKRGFYFIIGCFYGMVNRHDYRYPHACTEDLTRSILAYKRDGAVIRFQGFGPQTSYLKEPGGLQTYRTPDIQRSEMSSLVAAYPDLLVLREKPHGFCDVRFRRRPRTLLQPFS